MPAVPLFVADESRDLDINNIISLPIRYYMCGKLKKEYKENYLYDSRSAVNGSTLKLYPM